MILLRIGDANCSDTLANSHPDQLVTSCEELDTDVFKEKKINELFVIVRVGFVGTFSLVFCVRSPRASVTLHTVSLCLFMSCDFFEFRNVVNE